MTAVAFLDLIGLRPPLRPAAPFMCIMMFMVDRQKVVAVPNGLCWDDCGAVTRPGSFFITGHDKRAERYLVAIEGSQTIAERLAGLGYVPGEGNLRGDALAHDPSYETCGRVRPDGQECRIIGKGAGMRRHRADDAQHGPASG